MTTATATDLSKACTQAAQSADLTTSAVREALADASKLSHRLAELQRFAAEAAARKAP